MRAQLRAILLAIGLLLGAVPASAGGRELPDFTALVAQYGRAVVNISATQATTESGVLPKLDESDPMFEFFRRILPLHPGMQPQAPEENRSLGSGFIVSSDGYILTNAHVVADAEEVVVRLSDKREFVASIVGADSRSDIALLKIDARGLPCVVAGDPSRLKVGEWVAAIGSPFGFEQTVTVGVVSAKGRSLPDEVFVPFIQTDVAINPGNSGGPLFNLRGEVVGINSQIYSRTGGFMGLAFAIPIDVAMNVKQQLRASGKVRRGRIGVVIQEVTRELAQSFALPRTTGALVSMVEPISPADKAGLRQGDLILRVDGREVQSSDDLPRMIGGMRPGSAARLTYLREGRTRDALVSVGELSEGEARPAFHPARLEALPNPLGLVLAEMSASTRRERKLDAGLIVSEARGVAARAQLQPGDLVLALVEHGHHQALHSLAQYKRYLSLLQEGQVVTLLVSRADSASYVSLKVGR